MKVVGTIGNQLFRMDWFEELGLTFEHVLLLKSGEVFEVDDELGQCLIKKGLANKIDDETIEKLEE